MNLQDYNKWQDWDQNLETEPQNPQRLLWIIALIGAITVAALWTITIAVELYEWLRNSDPIELMTALWVVVCVALFLAGMLVTLFN